MTALELRILAIQETDWVERNPIVHHRMLEELSRRGADVTVIDFDIEWRSRVSAPVIQPRRERRDVRRLYPDARIRLIRPAMVRLPLVGRLSWLAANALELMALRPRPDIVVAYGISNAYLALRFARRWRVPFVYHVMDALHTHADAAIVRAIARDIECRVMRDADRVVVVSKGLAVYAREMGAPPARTEVIPIPANRVAPEPERGARVRGALGVRDDEVMLLFAGWLYPFSGVRELLADLARRRGELPWARLVIVGDGELAPELRRLHQEAGLGEKAILTGRLPQSEVGGYIEAADICLVPARPVPVMRYLMPTKVVEYMERGKCVIATRTPGMESEVGELPGIVFTDGATGVLDRVLELAASGPARLRDEVRERGETCRRFIREREDWAAATNRFARVLASLVSARA